MSYDLWILTPEAGTPSQVHAAVLSGGPGLVIGDGSASGHWAVRDADRGGASVFTLEGPKAVALEDLPDEAMPAALPPPRILYEVFVDGEDEVDRLHAIAVAMILARTLDGVVYNPQTGEARNASGPVSTKPRRGERVAVVELEWFGLRQTFPADFPHNLLSVMSATLPESRPRRFGDVEPLAGDYDTSGEEGFVAAWRSAQLLFWFTGTPPFVGGSFPPEDVPEGKFWSMSASILADSLQDPAWELTVRRFFVAVADAMPAFHASAAVEHGHIWTGRSLRSDSQTDFISRTLDPHDGWLGLPPEPRWLAYFGQPYLDIAEVADALPPEHTSTTRAGKLVALPLGAAEAAHRWIPREYSATLTRNRMKQAPPPMKRASTIPAELS